MCALGISIMARSRRYGCLSFLPSVTCAVQTVRDILAEARRIEAERAADEMADRIVANPEQFDVAANDNPNKENEATTPRE